ncbi:hypothetical protein [Chryseobacterium flavum]|uniref:hypothetical protein n=1 Tax=Chryseobacterium flavum TaxID=415851 RepID=UPI002FD9A6F7
MKKSTDEQTPKSGIMSSDLIKTLIENYRQNHLNAINSNLNIKDAHSIWFDLPKLKRFIATMENEARKVNPNCTEDDLGIRFYYAAYPKTESWEIMKTHPVPEEYAEKHTLVLIPTMKKENETGETLHYDFNPLYNEQTMALALNSRSKKQQPKNENSIGENSGQLIPPSDSKVESF